MAFYSEFQFDSANLEFDGNIIYIYFFPFSNCFYLVAQYPFNSNTQKFATQFQLDMLQIQSTVPYLFSPNCYQHGITTEYIYIIYLNMYLFIFLMLI